MTKLVKESLNEGYSYSHKEFMKMLGKLNDSLDYFSSAEHKDLWFLKDNPDINRIIDEMVDKYYELGDHLDRIDWGKTDWQNMKKWNWDAPKSYHDKAPGSASNTIR